MTNLMKASNQWAKRPADERFETLEALRDFTHAMRGRSATAKVRSDELAVEADGSEIVLVGKTGKTARVTHSGFSGLCQRAAAPATYLRTLSADTAVQCLREGLAAHADDTTNQLLMTKREDGGLSLRGMSGSAYQRIWNAEIADWALDLQARQPSWQFPEPFRTASGETGIASWGKADGKQAPTAFASDVDVFLFLCDYERGVDLGDAGQLARGFFIENPEIPGKSFRGTFFLFDSVCCNLIVWGVQDLHEVNVKHVGEARRKAFEELAAQVNRYAHESAAEQEQTIRQAMEITLGKDEDEVVTTVNRKGYGLTRQTLREAFAVADATPRYGSPTSIWGMVNGLTEVSQQTVYADQRAAIDRGAGKLLQLAA